MSRFVKTTVLYSVCSCLFVACGLLDLKVRTVYFNTNGAEAIPQQSITYGHKVATPDPMPTRKGYSFAGWYANPELNTRYDFNLPVKDNMTLYAKWVSPQEVRLIGLHASMKGETMAGVINEGSTPPTVTLTLQRSHHFGADLSTAILTKITVSPEGSTTNKQVGDVINVTLKAGKTITVTSFDDKHSRSYEVLLRYQSDPARVITYNGTDTLGQAVKDTVLLPQDIVLSAYNLAPLTSFGFLFDNVTGKVSSDEYGTVLFERSQLESTTARPGQVLRLTYRGDTLDLAPYQPYDIWDWRDLQAMRQDLNGSYRLMKDITFPDGGEPGFNGRGFVSVGSQFPFTPFSGNFDGQYHTISNFSILRSLKTVEGRLSYDGLFGFIMNVDKSNPCVIKNMTIRLKSIVTARKSVGVLAGGINNVIVTAVGIEAMTPESRIDVYGGLYKISLNGFIKQHFIGGLIGAIVEHSVVKGYTTADVRLHIDNKSNAQQGGEMRIGGLVGEVRESTVTGYATGNVSMNRVDTTFTLSDIETIGGLIGHLDNRSAAQGYATGNVSASGYNSSAIYAGGLVGYLSLYSTLKGYSTGNVTAQLGTIGGMVGLGVSQSSDESLIEGYARGNLRRRSNNANRTFGRLVGEVGFNTVMNAYHSGKAGESELLPASFTDAIGVDGTAVTISASTTQQDFSGFTFGNATGEWTFTSGRWPAINLPPEVGGNYLPQDQPTSP